MIIGHLNSDRVTIELRDAAPSESPSAGDIALAFTVVSGAFSGAVPNVWFSRTDIESFLGQLRSLEVHRSGVAELISISENHYLELTFDSPTSPLSILGDFLTHHYSLSEFHQHRLQFGFSLEQEYLRQLVADFTELFSKQDFPTQET